MEDLPANQSCVDYRRCSDLQMSLQQRQQVCTIFPLRILLPFLNDIKLRAEFLAGKEPGDDEEFN